MAIEVSLLSLSLRKLFSKWAVFACTYASMPKDLKKKEMEEEFLIRSQ